MDNLRDFDDMEVEYNYKQGQTDDMVENILASFRETIEEIIELGYEMDEAARTISALADEVEELQYELDNS